MPAWKPPGGHENHLSGVVPVRPIGEPAETFGERQELGAGVGGEIVIEGDRLAVIEYEEPASGAIRGAAAQDHEVERIGGVAAGGAVESAGGGEYVLECG